MVIPGHCTCIGKLVKPHGIQGQLILKNTAIISEEIEKTEWVFVEINKGLVPFLIHTCEWIDDKSLLISFEDYTSLQKATKLCGYNVYIKNKTTTKKSIQPSTIEWTGFTAFDTNNKKIGIITDIDPFEKNPMIIIDNGKYLIPLNNNFIQSVNKKQKSIYFNLPEGLLEL